uniref:cupin domain-containing protein n=1 Tax=Aquibium sp. A9E412 TaxID=2976767 RepID=UPI00339D6F3D
MPVSLFFAQGEPVETERDVVVRAAARRRLADSEAGLTEELLTPDLGGGFQVVRCSFAPGARRAEPRLRPCEEAGHLIAGTLALEIDGIWHRLEAGDSFRFRGKAVRWHNPGGEPAVAVWIVSPPAL